MTTTRQSIVTWHPWPENGVEGLPEGEWMIGMVKGKICSDSFKRVGARLAWTGSNSQLPDHIIGFNDYALASDLETVHEIDGDATIKDSLKVQNEDRVRWLVEQAVVISASQPDMSCLNAIEYVIGLASEARAQVELERKEANHE